MSSSKKAFFRTVIVESTDIRVHSEIRVQVVLTSHSIEVDALAVLTSNIEISATIKIATTVQYPFWIDMVAVTSNNTAEFDITAAGITADANYPGCVDALQAGPQYTACTQHWKFDSEIFDMASECIDPAGDGAINAEFRVDYFVRCFNTLSDANCPLNGNEAMSDAVLKLKSSRLCPDVVATVDITGSLESYEDSDHDDLKNAFFEDDIVYMKGEVGTTAQLTITASRINSVQCGNIVVYALNGASPAALLYTEITPTDALRNDFSFKLTGDFAAQTPALGSTAFSCSAEFEVQFTGMSTYQKVSMKFTPKLLQDLDSQAIAASTEISIQQRPSDAAEADDTVMEAEDAEITDASSSGKSNDWVLAVVVVVVLVAVLGACVLFGYVAHKRRHKRASVDHVQHDALATGSGSTVEDMDF